MFLVPMQNNLLKTLTKAIAFIIVVLHIFNKILGIARVGNLGTTTKLC